jgi:hypothetical protein
MKKLRTLFILPFILCINIIVMTKVYIRHKRHKDISNENLFSSIVDCAKPLIDKYQSHSLPFSATFWILLYVIIS